MSSEDDPGFTPCEGGPKLDVCTVEDKRLRASEEYQDIGILDPLEVVFKTSLCLGALIEIIWSQVFISHL